MVLRCWLTTVICLFSMSPEVRHLLVRPLRPLRHSCNSSASGANSASPRLRKRPIWTPTTLTLPAHDVFTRSGSALGHGLVHVSNTVNPSSLIVYLPVVLAEPTAGSPACAYLAGMRREASAAFLAGLQSLSREVSPSSSLARTRVFRLALRTPLGVMSSGAGVRCVSLTKGIWRQRCSIPGLCEDV